MTLLAWFAHPVTPIWKVCERSHTRRNTARMEDAGCELLRGAAVWEGVLWEMQKCRPLPCGLRRSTSGGRPGPLCTRAPVGFISSAERSGSCRFGRLILIPDFALHHPSKSSHFHSPGFLVCKVRMSPTSIVHSMR